MIEGRRNGVVVDGVVVVLLVGAKRLEVKLSSGKEHGGFFRSVASWHLSSASLLSPLATSYLTQATVYVH